MFSRIRTGLYVRPLYGYMASTLVSPAFRAPEGRFHLPAAKISRHGAPKETDVNSESNDQYRCPGMISMTDVTCPQCADSLSSDSEGEAKGCS